jgi:hypothetical protein
LTVVVWVFPTLFVIWPPNVRVLPDPLSVIVRLPPFVIAPVPRFKSFDPPNAKFALKFIALFVVRVRAPPLVLSMVPPPIVNAPVPIAEVLLMFNVPELRVVPPA